MFAALGTAVIKTIFSASQLVRDPNLLFLCLTKGHLVHPFSALALVNLVTCRSVLISYPALRTQVGTFWDDNTQRTFGPISTLRQLCGTLKWTKRPGAWIFDREGDSPVYLLDEGLETCKHEIRRSLKYYLANCLSARKDAPPPQRKTPFCVSHLRTQ